MYKLLLVTFFSFLLNANPLNNPKPYGALGDVIYDNVDSIDSLGKLDSYSLYKEDIQEYVQSVTQTKEEGFKLELQKASITKREYLNKLRELSKKNDYYLRTAKASYKNSMNTNNFTLFSDIINSGLINTDKNKKEIIDYYYKHSEDINSSGVIDNFLNSDAKLRALKDAQKKHYKTKKQLEEEKIKRIRANDKAAKEKLEKELQEDLQNKKLKIRQEQKKELAN